MRSVSSDTLRQLARLDLSPVWDVRLVDQDNRVLTIPPGALKGRQRGAELDGSTWRLSLSLDRSLLPSGTDPKQYHAIEMDLLLGSDTIPYFRGIIDHPQGGESLQGGAITEPLELECLGVLQKTKGMRINYYSLNPSVQAASPTYQLMALCKTERYSPNTALTAPDDEWLPRGAATWQADTYLKIYTDSTLAAEYVKGADFTLDLFSSPVKITWLNDPATTRVIEHAKLERYVYPAIALSGYSYTGKVLPVDRSYDDRYPTTIAAWDDSVPAALTLTPSDSTGWRDLPAGQEYVTVTLTDGTEVTYNFSTVDAVTGKITLNYGGAFPVTLDVGCSMRLSTTEYLQAWDDDRLIKFYTDALGTTEWNRRFIRAIPGLGYATAPEPRNWTELIYSDLAYVRQDVDANRLEDTIKALLVATALFSSGDVTTGESGVYVKNHTFMDTDVETVLQELARNLPPNAFLHDEPDGTVTIQSYQQATEPDWVMRGAHDIQEADQPEPVSAITVIAESEQEINLAPGWFYSSSNFTNPERVIDGNKTATLAAAATTSTNPATLTFRIPRPDPITSFPVIEKIRVTGNGLLTAYVVRGGVNYYLTGWTFEPLTNGTAEIDGETLNRALLAPTSDYQELVFVFDPYTTGDDLSVVTVAAGGSASCAEVEIFTKIAGSWKAELTDDTAVADDDQGADEFGTIWTQADISKRESWRYAPPEYVKRTSVKYYAPGGATASRPRHLILRFRGISQQACRDYAERWCDYKLMEGKTYTVSGILDPRAQLGDTVRFFRKDGSYLDGFLWSISDSGGPDDLSCTYGIRIYA